ncbi:MAG: hypothetical protein RIF33_23680 [Cyclobacteriaceae bacterium]
MDIISVILGIFGIAQNVRIKSSHKEKVKHLLQIYDQLSLVYGYLDDAKIAHDEFQKFQTASHHHFNKFHLESQLTRSILSEHVKLYLANYQMFNKSLIKQFSSNVGQDYIPGNEPKYITDSLEIIIEINPEFVKGISQFKDASISLKNQGGQGYNDEVQKLLLVCEHSINDVLQNADTIILNTVPVLGYIQLQIHEGIKTLE